MLINKKDNLQFQIKNGNGNVKEYSISQYNVTTLFEGEYINGEKNGKGRKYMRGNLIFEGEFLNDEYWKGKGRFYPFSRNIAQR